ncbi:MAG TPA: hypothetical protein VFN76_02720 [Candidatus Limnocylindria bacterium]|nr:hypothetical protein [Candidatus Limnocylindria bacterium]
MTITAVQAVLYASIAVAAGSALWAAFFGRTLRRMLVGLGITAAALAVLVVTLFASMGAFCTAPPGAACL